MLAGEGVGGPNSDEGTDTLVLCILYSCLRESDYAPNRSNCPLRSYVLIARSQKTLYVEMLENQILHGMGRYVKECQSMPRAAQVCQGMPRNAKVCQRMPRYESTRKVD